MKHIWMLAVVVIAAAGLFAGCADDTVLTESSVIQADLSKKVQMLERRAEPVMLETEELAQIAAARDGGSSHWLDGAFVELPAGSVDALADAIAGAGPGGIVYVRSGLHTESTTVTVSRGVRIVGEAGAVMQMDTQPFTTFPATLDPAIHILSSDGRVIIWGIDFIPEATIGGTAILVENSPDAVIANNTFTDFQVSIYLQQADDAKLVTNTVVSSAGWQTGDIPLAFGIVIANGDRAGLMKNDISLAFFGVWACDASGMYAYNSTHNNYIGLILCKVPSGFYFTPGGSDAGSDVSATEWLVRRNTSSSNLGEGYLVIDSANNNVLVDNSASGNGTYDFELTGDTYRFGFLTPASYENMAIIGGSTMSVKDCGNENIVVGGALVDNNEDPCY